MSHPSELRHAPPAEIRAALIRHLARKLGWCSKTASHVLRPLSTDDIARCLNVDPEQTRTALFARSCMALGVAAQPQAVA